MNLIKTSCEPNEHHFKHRLDKKYLPRLQFRLIHHPSVPLKNVADHYKWPNLAG